MSPRTVKWLTVGCLLVILLLAAENAHAFRCNNRLVKDGMHEQQVLALCGEPASRRHLGYVTRVVAPGWRRLPQRGFQRERYPGPAAIATEVALTEYVYNFGPRRFMRRLLFEGGVLTRIETIGYGYLD